MPAGEQLLISSSLAVQGSTTEKTFCSRMRRAMSCVYCAPKSRMTMVSSGEAGLCLGWFSTEEFLKFAPKVQNEFIKTLLVTSHAPCVPKLSPLAETQPAASL